MKAPPGRRGPTAPPPAGPSVGRRRVFPVLALLIPVLAFGALEAGLRLFDYGGDTRLFRPLSLPGGRYEELNRHFAARYFVGVKFLPEPTTDVLLAKKPANGFRVFVLGESTVAGVPYGYNGTFSRLLRDALRDVLPRDSVEVVNLGISAISSYTLYDQVGEVVAQHPDAVLLYVGHNEYYGALGVGSTERVGGSPALVRAYLTLQRLKIFLLARDLAVTAARALGRGTLQRSDQDLMEYVAREKDIPLGGPVYERGVGQFRDNLRAIVRRFRAAGVAVFVGSLTSNLRDQPPFRPLRGGRGPAADSVYGAAQAALARRDTGEARRLYGYARDLDGLRFRAPGEFNGVIREVVRAEGARYVPVAEAFAAAAPQGIEGRELFWEHVHPTQAGYVLMARAYYAALAAAGFLGHAADPTRLRSWQAYAEGMELTAFDHRFAWHEVHALMNRWPFVAHETPGGYPGDYRPVDFADTAAFSAVYSGGDPGWAGAKTYLAEGYLKRGEPALAVAEYRGLIREQPINPPLLLSAAAAYERLSDSAQGLALAREAYGIEPSATTSYALGSLELRAKRYADAIPLLEEALRYAPDNAPVLFDLSRAYILVRDLARARYYADRLAAVNPSYPGLAEWRAMLGELRD